MKAIITVGLGFGDEGKGATVDYLARSLNADLVVRFCGGAQAGHNVQLPDGGRHTFAQFGAGTFAGARTYLGSKMILSPATLLPEAEHLQSLGIPDPVGMLTAHPDCLVSTIYHVAMNRLREFARGAKRHGSCGLGMGETRSYWLRYGRDAIVAEDLLDRPALLAKLTLLRDRFLLEMQELSSLDPKLQAMLRDTMPAVEADMLQAATADLRLSERLPPCRTVIFEGAQGVLLDEWYGFHPHTTWSTVTPYHALEIVREAGISDVTVLGVTRAMTTRHGVGPFPSEGGAVDRTTVERGNPPNDWQGVLRAGPLDLMLLDYAIRVCDVDGLVVNCLDHLPETPRLCTSYGETNRIQIPNTLKQQSALTRFLQTARPVVQETSVDELLEQVDSLAPVWITADGPTSTDRAERRMCQARAAGDRQCLPLH
jgi:adenylosuccinate synthase